MTHVTKALKEDNEWQNKIMLKWGSKYIYWAKLEYKDFGTLSSWINIATRNFAE